MVDVHAGNPGQPDKYFLAGIVSWGKECGSKTHPGIYTKGRISFLPILYFYLEQGQGLVRSTSMSM